MEWGWKAGLGWVKNKWVPEVEWEQVELWVPEVEWEQVELWVPEVEWEQFGRKPNQPWLREKKLAKLK